jgi:K+-sensing histidine kinase KdpD/CheY-like chemotaxis protein
MKKPYFIFLLLSILVLSAFAQSNPEVGLPFITNYDPKEYQAGQSNWAIIKDDRGVMYFGNDNGILEFDGASWRLILFPNQSTGRSLCKGPDGTIYAGGVGDFGYLKANEQGQMHFVSLLPEVPEQYKQFADVWSTYGSQEGIYFRTDKYIFRWNGKQMKVWEATNRFHMGFIVNGIHYLRQWGIGLMKMENDSLVLVPGGQRFASERIYVMLPFDKKQILVGTRTQGLFLYDGQTFKPFKTGADVFLAQNQLYLPGAILPDSTIALGTFSGGMAVIDHEGHLLYILDKSKGLLDNAVDYIYPDPSGDGVWLALYKGISYLEIPSPLSVYGPVSGLEFPIYDIVRHKGILYVATNIGTFWLDKAVGKFKLISGTADQCWDLLSLDDGVYLAQLNAGLVRINGDQVTVVRPSVNYDFRANSIYNWRHNPDFLFVGLDDGIGVLKRVNNRWQDVVKIPANTTVFNTCEDDNGNLWLGSVNSGSVRIQFDLDTQDDITAVKSARIEYLGTQYGLPSGVVYPFRVNKKIYFATFGGLYTFDGQTNRFEQDSTFSSVGFNRITQQYFMTEDSRGRVWMNFGAESAVATPQKDGTYSFEKTPFLRFSGDPMFAIYPEKNGIVWFGGGEELIRYDSSVKKNYAVDYSALIRRVVVGEDSLIYGGAFIEKMGSKGSRKSTTLDYAHNSLRFQFAAPTYDNPRAIQYQSMLVGFDQRWSPWSKDNKRDYTNLPAGTYKFHVHAKNIYEHISSEALYEFKILFPWYSTWWAYFLYVLFGAGVVFAVVRLRTRKLEIHRRELEQTVRERTQEITQRVEELGVINSVQEGLVRELDMKAIYEMVGDRIRDLFDAQAVLIATFDHKVNLEYFQYTFEKGQRYYPEPRPIERIRSYLIQTKQLVLINEDFINNVEEFGGAQIVEGTEVPKSVLFVPLVVGETVKGYVSLQNIDRENAFNDSAVRLLTTLANSMSVALENARLFGETTRLLKETEQRNAELAVINSVQEGLVRELEMQSIYDMIGERIRDLFDAQAVIIATFDHDADMETHVYNIEKGKRVHPEPRPIDKIRRYLIDKHETVLINENLMDVAVKRFGIKRPKPVPGTEMPKSALWVPLIVGETVKGYVSLQNIDREHAFSDSDVRLLTTLANSMSVALENARLFDETTRLLKETEQRNAELAVINSVQDGLVKELNIQSIYDLVGNRIASLFDIQTVIIRTFDHETGLEHWHFATEKGKRLDSEPRPFIWANRQLIKTRQPMLIKKDYIKTAQKYDGSGVTVGKPPKSAVFVPMIVGDQVRGSISLQNVERENAFHEDDVRLLSTLASSMSVALENARLFDETKRLLDEAKQRAAELSTVNSISKALVGQLELNALIQLVGEQMYQLFHADSVYVALLDKKANVINFPYQVGEEHTPLKFGEGLTSRIIQTGEPQLLNKNVGERYSKLGIKRRGKHAASYLGVPIPVGNEMIGVISVQSWHQEGRFGEDDMHLLSTIAANVGVALQNASLFEEAKQARAVAEEANEAKSAFLSTVSHELRTPLTSVLGFAKIIKKRLEDKIFPTIQNGDSKIQRTIDQVEENLGVVVAEGERLTTLINNVLDLAKIEAGKIEWNMETINVSEIIERAAAATSSLFDNTEVKFIKDVEPDLPEIIGDQDKLIQVVINLISNAIKFTEKGSVTCRAKRTKDEMTVSVIDTGMGISQEDQSKVFDKFKQVGDTLTNKPKGTGLGLTISKEIIEVHGGKIQLKSKEGEGSTFYFTLPVKAKKVEEGDIQRIDLTALMTQLKQSVQTTTVNSQSNELTILVVDDEAHIRELLNQELGEAGYKVQVAENGRDAIEKIRQQHPDLVILDVMMPEMNGFDVAAVLKNDPATMDIPIIILSIVQDKERGFRLGIDRYLTKPIDTELLFQEIGALLEQGKSKKKVMVVDEDASTVKTLAEVLQTRGYHVVEANGLELVEKAVSEQPDIIILNSVLSEKQEVVKTLRFEKGLENVLFLVYQ